LALVRLRASEKHKINGYRLAVEVSVAARYLATWQRQRRVVVVHLFRYILLKNSSCRVLCALYLISVLLLVSLKLGKA
jgi:hypothetical protein